MYKNIVFYNVKPHTEHSYAFHADKDGLVRNIHFSAGRNLKFFIYKNEEQVAVLFTSKDNLNASYMHSIEVHKDDRIGFNIINQDVVTFDAYANYEVL